MEKFKSEAHEKDFILETIRAKSPLNVLTFEMGDPFNFFSIFTHHRAEFELDKLINVIEISGYEANNGYLVELTSAGFVFLNRGGYRKQEDERNDALAKENNERQWRKAEVLISLLAFLVAFASFVNSCQDSKTVNQQSFRIDSLKVKVSAMQDSITLLRSESRKAK